MTIFAGFKCSEGVVLCTDTQETISGTKKKVPKLRFEERTDSALTGLPELAVAVCGAGYGPFIDKLADEIWEVAQQSASLAEACESAEEAIKDMYREFGKIYQMGSCPEVELIYGIKADDDSRLFHASGPIVNEKDGYSASGSGAYMADYLASNMYHKSLSVRQGVILAAYVLFQAKEHADGCGGDSHIAVLRENDTSGSISSNRIETLTNLLSMLQSHTGNILLDSADLGITKEEFAKRVSEAVGIMHVNRDNASWKIKNWDSFWGQMFPTLEIDDVGLFGPKKLKQSDSQK